jgi:hypothetical protein
MENAFLTAFFEGVEIDHFELPLVAYIMKYGNNGECIKVNTSRGDVYIVLDEAREKWLKTKTGRIRVLFTLSEIMMLCEKYKDKPPSKTLLDEWFITREVFPLSTIIS